MTKIRDADLLTLFRHENPDSSGTVDACATSCISSGRYRRVVSRLRKACDSVENYLGYGPNTVGARRAALRRWGTAGRCPTKLWEVVGRNMGTWEKRKAGEKVHLSPRYWPNCLLLLHTRKHPYLQNHGVHRSE
ncbi:hypothetical protein PISMIDRAFT_689892 [Pisolithus microcarpus 441]|uniref:Uncharacterized protein n=1 Tax=Pisolithus microcarpus 441 TaxID=765257 RepID=A0A0C9XI94_9AGAM|nr:hypothetical protein BKA83DRAFT_689892 [Pisolithus microcarpus]KIK12000.1 hypothetical protein PISMIDRAFT_689892 [Pisolithus microcarpus 441]